MTDKPTSDIYSGRFPNFAPFFDLTQFSEMNRNMLAGTAKLSATLQALNSEWAEFIVARLREDSRLMETLGECRTLPDLQHAYAQFWEKAVAQYGEEAQRVMRITQGAAEDVVHAAQERTEIKHDAPQARAA